jgi:hypothetical protein
MSNADLLQIHIMVMITLLFSSNLSIIDVIIASSMYLRYPDIVKKVRNFNLIVMGICVPLALSPLMLELWVATGVGNANYFFFQGICLWLFCALGIVEFINALLRDEMKSIYV